VIGALMPLRASHQDQALGMDPTQHGEEAYASGEGTVLVLPELTPEPRLESARAEA